MFNNIRIKLKLKIFSIRFSIIDWLIKDDYEMQFFPDLYDAPLMIFITGWLINKAQTTGFVGDIFNFIDRKGILFNKLLKYGTKIQDDWVKAYYEKNGEEYVPFFS